jgi:hypothetical protein
MPSCKLGQAGCDDLAGGWVWVALETNSKIMQIRVVNSGRVEMVVYDELTSKETVANYEIGSNGDLVAALDQCLVDLLAKNRRK